MSQINKALLSDLRVLGVRKGGHLLVHSSFKSLGEAAGSPDIVIDTLMAALGDNGTLLMPALSYETVNAAHPYFDVRKTASCVGILPETFRKRPAVLRSLHPTHSVAAWGRDAKVMTHLHHLDNTPVGAHSPFRLLKYMRGQLLFIGCGLSPNTSMHGVEELVNPPYLYAPGQVSYTCVDENGQSHILHLRGHGFTDENGAEIEQRYDRVSDLMSGDALLYGRLLAADCFLLDARSLWDTAEAALRENPLCFVSYPDADTLTY